MSSTRTRRLMLATAAVAAGAAPVMVGAASASAATMPTEQALSSSTLAQHGVGGGQLEAIPVSSAFTGAGQGDVTNPIGLTSMLTPDAGGLQPTTHPMIPSNTGTTNDETRSATNATDVVGTLSHSVSLPNADAARGLPADADQTVNTGLPSVQRLAGNTENQVTSPVVGQSNTVETAGLPDNQLVDQATALTPGGGGLSGDTRTVPSVGTVTQSLPTRGVTSSLPDNTLAGPLGSTPLGNATDSLGQF